MKSGWLARSVLVGGSVVVSLFLLEGMIWMWYPQSQYAIALAPWGFTHRPNARVMFYGEANARKLFGNAPLHAVSIHYNSKGLRDYEYPYEKPPGTFRILFLGDSWAEDMGSEFENLHVKWLERKLNALGGPVQFEVINAGHYAYDNAQELMWYLQEGLQYDPDLVIVLYVSDTADPEYATAENGELRLHYHTYTVSQKLYRWSVSWIRSHSHLGTLVLDRLNHLRFVRQWLVRKQWREQPVSVPVVQVGGSMAPPSDGFALVDQLIWRKFRDTAKAHESRFIMFSIAPLTPGQWAWMDDEEAIPVYAFPRPEHSPAETRQADIRAGTYDPRYESHRFGYKANEWAAQKMFQYLRDGDFIPVVG